MSKPLHEVTDEDLLREGLADFILHPQPVMPWRTEKQRLTGEPPTAEEWHDLLTYHSDEAIALRSKRQLHPEYFHPNYGRF